MIRILSQTAIALVLTLNFSVTAEPTPFGRIFSSQLERQNLDAIRHQVFSSDKNLSTTTATPETAESKNKPIAVSGILLMEDGRSVIWIDGKSKISSSGIRNDIQFKVQKSLSAKTRIQYDNQVRILEPGQVWMPNDNAVKESYEVNGGGSRLKDKPPTGRMDSLLNSANNMLHRKTEP